MEQCRRLVTQRIQLTLVTSGSVREGGLSASPPLPEGSSVCSLSASEAGLVDLDGVGASFRPVKE